MGLAWYHRIKEEDPERYQAQLDRVREWNRRYYADPEYRQRMVAKSSAYRAEKSKDPEWVAKEKARKLASAEKKRLEKQLAQELERELALAFAT